MRVVVIGAGLAGVTTAWFLRQQGVGVVVVERGSAVARETSYANGSMLTPSLADPWNAPGSIRAWLTSIGREDAAMLLRPAALPSLLGWGLRFIRSSRQKAFLASFLANVHLARYSQQVMAELLQGMTSEQMAFDYAPDGTVKVFATAESWQRGREIASWLRQAGIEHRVLDRDALLGLEPALQPGGERLVGGIHYPQDEVGNARLFCEALYQQASEAGVDFRFSELVLGVERRNGLISAIRTSRELLTADAFVLAAGSFSWPLGRKFGIRVPVRPAKGYSLTLPNVGVPRPRLAVVDDALHAAVVPVGDDLLRAAGTAEFAGFDSEINPRRIDNLKTLLATLYPQLDLDSLRGEPWCGFRPMTTDGRPLLGASRIKNLYLNTGHGPLGWTLACGSSQALAEQIVHGRSSFDISQFDPARF